MHIMEGFLPWQHALFWTGTGALCLGWGLRRLKQRVQTEPESLLLLGAAGGFCFLLSSLKLPSVMGSSSHATGVALGALLLGTSAMLPVGFLVLVFQAMLLAHGGLSTLGANLFTLVILGGGAAVLVQKLLQGLGSSTSVQAFGAALASSLATYTGAAGQLAMAFSQDLSGLGGTWIQFMLVYAPTQIPLALLEGVVTASILSYLTQTKTLQLREGGLL